tara:strand:- start:1138 stop:1536 length:399 start_codon:yes stop_codon:yes gene_type:complete
MPVRTLCHRLSINQSAYRVQIILPSPQEITELQIIVQKLSFLEQPNQCWQTPYFSIAAIYPNTIKVGFVCTLTFQSPKMLHHPPTAASTSRAAALQLKVNGRSGPFVSIDMDGREADIRCVSKTGFNSRKSG